MILNKAHALRRGMNVRIGWLDSRPVERLKSKQAFLLSDITPHLVWFGFRFCPVKYIIGYFMASLPKVPHNIFSLLLNKTNSSFPSIVGQMGIILICRMRKLKLYYSGLSNWLTVQFALTVYSGLEATRSSKAKIVLYTSKKFSDLTMMNIWVLYFLFDRLVLDLKVKTQRKIISLPRLTYRVRGLKSPRDTVCF